MMKKILNGKEIELSPEEQASFIATQAELSAELEAKEPEINYKKEMPTPQESLDMLYELGYDQWKAAIKKIKDKYPDVLTKSDKE